MSTNSGAMQLRYLQTLADMSTNNSSTIVFPLPMDIMETFMKKAAGPAGSPTVSPGSGSGDRPTGSEE